MPQPPAVETDTQLQNLIDQGFNGNSAVHDALAMQTRPFYMIRLVHADSFRSKKSFTSPR